ncbi:MAG: NERD domain-containing protein [Oligoflexales bacterium]
MAKIFPDVEKTRVVFVSQAEQQFYNTCKETLPDPWQVYYSCTLSRIEPGEGLKDNEIDFVLYHPSYGLIVVEVKGGRIEFDAETGEFSTLNRQGRKYTIRNPFQQVLNWKSRFLRYLKDQGIKVPVTHAVCFPTVSESEFPATAEVEPVLLIGRTRILDLKNYLIHLVKNSQPEKFLNFQDVGSQIDKILRGASFSTRLYVADYLESHELRLKDVEAVHESLITPIANTQRMAIEGEAGTGKTMLALMLAKHFRDSGRKVLLIASNPLLNAFLKIEAGDKVDVMTYTELASSFGIELMRRPSNYQGTKDDWTQLEGPEKLKDAIKNSTVRYDIVICDEAQDVQPFWWEALEFILASETSHFYIFFDRSQGVFGSLGKDETFVPEDVLPIKPPYFPLVYNYRTTREIAEFARPFRTGKAVLQSYSSRLGYVPELITYTDEADFKLKLEDLCLKLFEVEKLNFNDVTFLSARKPFAEGSIIKAQKKVGGYEFIELSELKKSETPYNIQAKDKIRISTIASFKGLETPIGVVLNLSEYNLPFKNAIMSSLAYVAFTRAKHMLWLMVKADDEKRAILESTLKNIQQTGSMVLEGMNLDSEFCGQITLYDADRVGFLKVDDPRFEKGNIMFFPYDVHKSQIENLTVGETLRFRAKIEGNLMLAWDLKR